MATDKTVSTPSPPPDPPAAGVRRRLDFGHQKEGEELEGNLSASLDAAEAETQRQRQRAREKWNFDFENEVPLDGDWEWEKVGGEQVPEFKEMVCSKVQKENRNV